MEKNYKQILVIGLLFLFIGGALAQNATLKGKVTGEGNEELIGATIFVTNLDKNISQGTVTNLLGEFILNVDAGNLEVKVSFVGYKAEVFQAKVNPQQIYNMKTIVLNSASIGLTQVEVMADVAIDRKTPVAISSIKAEAIEMKISTGEFPEVLNTTPSVFSTKSGGGYGDARINVRGFNQRNVAVLINGIPVNDMENGWVYWSNWVGLADATRTMQVQRGLGASKLAISSVGGTINIVTKTTDAEKGGIYRSTVGNDGFLKNQLTLSTGRMKGGWAITAAGSRTTGNGYVDQTWIDAWSYFGTVAKELGKNHMLVFTAVGAPQRHGQRSFMDKATNYENNIRFNSEWGLLNGNAYNLKENFYHKPQFSLNHYWTINEKLHLSSSAYVSFGRGGGTGDLGKIDGSKYYTFTDANGQIDWQTIYDYNRGAKILERHVYDVSGNDSTYYIQNNPDTDGERNVGIARRSSINSHNWYGFISSLDNQLADNVKLTTGVDLRYYKGEHYKEIDDLLGADYYMEKNNKNFSDGKKSYVGDLVEYHNDGLVNWVGVFGQLEYDTGLFSAFVAGSGSHMGFKRIDYFNYTDDNPEQTSDWQNFLGYTVKGGANYNLSEVHNVFFNTGYFSRQPKFDDIFVNYKNDIAKDITNEKVMSMELGYGFRSHLVAVKLNAYYTTWIDKAFQRAYTDESGDRYIANIVGQNALHKGVEAEVFIKPIDNLEINFMASVGDWRWKNDVDAKIFDDNQILVEEIKVYANDLRVGAQPQTTLATIINYKFNFGLGINAEYIFYDNYFADFNPTDRTDVSDKAQPFELDSYGLLNGGLFYNIHFNKFDLGLNLRVNNALDEVYFADAVDTKDHTVDGLNAWYGFGRTWSAGLKVSF
ncbi:MAG: TonB-dependent receptor plug domain-containing protein [Bacteroidales bacterium]|nr:TonB-dependent receptor plug domain-containing protein [Bacteroidales bacterium]